jgi:hypothetical protein
MNASAAIERFGIKHADFASLAPAIALPALGAFLGKRYFGDIGQLVGGVSGGLSGQLLREQLAQRGGSGVPDLNMMSQPFAAQPSQPYTIDPTTEDIPPWALQSARAMAPTLKQGAETEGLKDVVLGDVGGPLYPLVEGMRKHDMRQAVRGIGGQAAGVAGGGLAGYGTGLLLNHLLGHNINVPGVNIPLSTILSGLGATIGGVKGLQWSRR